MARPRTALAKAKLTGQFDRNRSRYRGRREMNSPALGPPPAHLTEREKLVWKTFHRELPWLRQADRAGLEFAVALRSRSWDDKATGVKAMSLLRQLLCEMGATPASRSKVYAPDDDNDPNDPTEKYLN